MDSRSWKSAPGSSSSPPSPFWKKLVGGICQRSPTTINWRPRATTPIASQTVIWEASSKIIKSKSWELGGRYWATERGLMRKQGLSSEAKWGSPSKSWRTGLWRVFFSHSLFKRVNSLRRGSLGASWRGMRALSRAKTCKRECSKYWRSYWQNCWTFLLWGSVVREPKSGLWAAIWLSILLAWALSTRWRNSLGLGSSLSKYWRVSCKWRGIASALSWR